MITKDLVNIGNASVTGKMFASKFVGPISGNADTATALTTSAGTATKPVYFSNGKPVATTYALQLMTAASASTAGAAGLVPAPGAGKQGQFLRGDGTWATPTNTTYSAATTSAAGLMSAADKSKLDAITASADAVSFSRSLTSGTKVGSITINGTATDIYAPTNTDTHHTAKLIAGNSATATANAAASNGSAYLNIIENGAVRSSHKIVGSGGTTVTTDANGVITIKSTDNNTTYTLNSFGITATAAELNILDGVTVNATKINYLTDVTSNIQAQLNGKAASSHGTHVTYATAVPLVAGTAAVGTAANVARGDHVHPAQTTISGNAGSATKLATARTIDGVSFNGSAAITHFGTCDTAAGTAAKTVALTGFSLVTGARVFVKFTYANTVANPTLNVNSTGAKAIVYRGSAISAAYLRANGTYEFLYDGTNWNFVGDLNTDANTTYAQATSSALGLVKIGYSENGKNYPVELNSSGQMFVNVPWTDNNTTYAQATSSALGLVKVGFTESGKNYPVELNSSGQMFVNVPWTDNNTTYSAATSSALGLVKIGSNITNSSGTISLTKDNVTAALGYTPPTTNTTYSAATTSAAGLMSAADKSKLNYTNIAYGTCTTASATAAKVITISGNSNWELTTSSIIIVLFSNTNTAASPTFNVNGTGAKSVQYGTAVINTTHLTYAGVANRLAMYVYDGSVFRFVSWTYDANTTYSNASLGQGFGTCSTAAATAAKVVALTNYALTTGGIVSVKFTYAVPANATMNINSKGAKSIFYKGVAITAGVINAGDIATFIYDGTQYQLISLDSGGSGSSSGNYVPTSGGTVTGNVQQSGATTDYTTYKFRNIAIGTSTTPTSDATYGVSGSIYIYCP